MNLDFPVKWLIADQIAGGNNFRANSVSALTPDSYTANIDHSLSDHDRLTYNRDNSNRVGSHATKISSAIRDKIVPR